MQVTALVAHVATDAPSLQFVDCHYQRVCKDFTCVRDPSGELDQARDPVGAGEKERYQRRHGSPLMFDIE